MNGLYLLVLTEIGGDLEVKVIDEETWAWIFGPSGKPHPEDVSWEDPFVPKRQQDLIAKSDEALSGDDDTDGLAGVVWVTSGSYENDRAIFAHPAEGYGICFSIEEMQRAVAAKGDTILEEWHGMIY